jgi:hypothetical protein
MGGIMLAISAKIINEVNSCTGGCEVKPYISPWPSIVLLVLLAGTVIALLVYYFGWEE